LSWNNSKSICCLSFLARNVDFSFILYILVSAQVIITLIHIWRFRRPQCDFPEECCQNYLNRKVRMYCFCRKCEACYFAQTHCPPDAKFKVM
jgi:hypothetical protein